LKDSIAFIDQPGSEVYPPFYALWPLIKLGVLDKEAQPTRAWQRESPPARTTRVAIIDTSVAVDHPNLRHSVNTDLSFDLVSNRLGAFSYVDANDEQRSAIAVTDLAHIERTLIDRMPPRQRQNTARLLHSLHQRVTVDVAKATGVKSATDVAFSAHGTAIAGLVGARPVQVAVERHPMEPVSAGAQAPSDIILPFAGVDPFCEIVQISTGFDPDPEHLILALLYAELIDADVVLLPRDFADPSRTVPVINDIANGIVPNFGQALAEVVYPAELQQSERDLWDELAALTVALADNRVLVCAAGNDGIGQAIYPASLATANNGIVSVGAVNAHGVRATYSNYGPELTVMAPSSDGVRFDRAQTRLDMAASNYTGEGVPENNDNALFSYLDVISTDVPGRYGYNSSPFEDAYLGESVSDCPDDLQVRDIGSFYCRFGGTSAASALIAGFISLGMSQGGLAHDAGGPAAKRWLLAQSTGDIDGTPIPFWPADLP